MLLASDELAAFMSALSQNAKSSVLCFTTAGSCHKVCLLLLLSLCPLSHPVSACWTALHSGCRVLPAGPAAGDGAATASRAALPAAAQALTLGLARHAEHDPPHLPPRWVAPCKRKRNPKTAVPAQPRSSNNTASSAPLHLEVDVQQSCLHLAAGLCR